jgi:CSLREA domain-containing protein
MNKIIRFFIPFIIAFLFLCMLICLFGISNQAIAGEDSISKSWTGKQSNKGMDAPPNSLLVNTLQDEVNNDGVCSLREAIEAANKNTSVDTCGAGDVLTDTITFEVAGTIIVNEQLEVSAGGPLIIGGGGTITLSGQSVRRVFTTTVDAELTLISLEVTLGKADYGAGIYNNGSLVVSDTSITTNTAYLYGGGIYNLGTLMVVNSALTGNIVNGLNCGGGIYNEGALSIINSTLTNNHGYSCGGAVSNHNGITTIAGSVISENHAGSVGGGISNSNGTMYLTDNILHGNSTSWGDGGGIYNQDGDLTIINNSISDNIADFKGGGIYSWQPITLYSTQVLIMNSSISGNMADEGGGIYNDSPSEMVLINSTLYGNSAANWGGGINNYDILTIANATISDNNVVNGYGGGMHTENMRSTTIQNTIIANNTATAYSGKDCDGAIYSNGYNIIGNTTGCTVDITTGDIIGMNPKLGPLQDNGGPTYTEALLSGSLAINHGNPSGCKDDLGTPLTMDQRGFPRTGRCDIGAYELQYTSGPYQTYLPCVSLSCTTLYFDGFDYTGSGWYSGVSEFAQYEYLNQEYRILMLQGDAWAGSRAPFWASDFIAEVDVRNQAEIDGSSGIIFGLSSDWSQFYSFEIYPAYGTYGIYRYGIYGWNTLAVGYSDSILLYPASNHIKVERKGGQIWAYINGQLTNIINETYYISSGYLGLIASSISQINYDTRFDNFTVYPISCGPANSYQSSSLDTPIYTDTQEALHNHYGGILERKSSNR